MVQPEYEALFRRLFHEPLAPQNAHRLDAAATESERHTLDIGKCVRLVVQEKQEGFGHGAYCSTASPRLHAAASDLVVAPRCPAVHCARREVGDEPFLVVLADHVYRAEAGAALCARQVLDAFARDHCGVMGLWLAPTAEGSRFGVAGAVADSGAIPKPGDGVSVTVLAEKPGGEHAATHLAVEGGRTCLTAFGIYAVPPSVWGALDEVVAHNMRELGSIQFTSALEILRQREVRTAAALTALLCDPRVSPSRCRVSAASSFAAGALTSARRPAMPRQCSTLGIQSEGEGGKSNRASTPSTH